MALSDDDKPKMGEQFQPSARIQSALIDAEIRVSNLEEEEQEDLPFPKVPYQHRVLASVAASTPRFAVIGWGKYGFSPLDTGTADPFQQEDLDQNEVVIKDTTNPQPGKWLVTQESGSNSLIEAAFAGGTWARVNVLDVNHGYVDWDTTANELQSGESGYAWLRVNPAATTGVQWCYLQLGCCGGGGETNCDCINALLDKLVEKNTLTAAESEEIKVACGCSVEPIMSLCPSCDNDEIAYDIPVSFTGWTADTGVPVAQRGPEYDGLIADAVAAMNQFNNFSLGGCSRQVVAFEDTRNGELLRVTVELSHFPANAANEQYIDEFSQLQTVNETQPYFYAEVFILYQSFRQRLLATHVTSDCRTPFTINAGDWILDYDSNYTPMLTKGDATYDLP